MSAHTENIEDLLKCTCLHNDDVDISDLVDADLCDPMCPIHGVSIHIQDN